MQQVRPSMASSSPSIRPGSQTPTAAVYPPPNQPIMMTMTPMPFPSPQAAQYYIPQVRGHAPNTQCAQSCATEGHECQPITTPAGFTN